jgi:predicted transcriptional regulator
MRTCQIDLLPVCEGERLVGMVSDRDIGARAAVVGLAAGQSKIRDAMTSEVVWCYESQDIEDAARTVDEHANGEKLPGLLVMDENKQLVGVVPAAALHMDYAAAKPGGIAGGPIEDVVDFQQDSADFMSNQSFPASDPLPPPSSVGPCQEGEEG